MPSDCQREILQALREEGPLGYVQLDDHSGTWDFTYEELDATIAEMQDLGWIDLEDGEYAITPEGRAML